MDQVFTNVHSYHINSISINSDCETFVSADDLRVNLWNMNVENQSFNIVDIKPDNMEDLTEARACEHAWKDLLDAVPCWTASGVYAGPG
jgi:hypothetical protein